ncbi:hypothetical protein TREES_T100014936 [Tupaia chinensis]|uniref:Uncharacterized protein n=1 Tax=Tupaia chinensis TaxID=246437 RepID=L9KP39_TUPCH|nr:hypothetical protein TREES_T100014936 [Tupaia chinensis]
MTAHHRVTSGTPHCRHFQQGPTQVTGPLRVMSFRLDSRWRPGPRQCSLIRAVISQNVLQFGLYWKLSEKLTSDSAEALLADSEGQCYGPDRPKPTTHPCLLPQPCHSASPQGSQRRNSAACPARSFLQSAASRHGSLRSPSPSSPGMAVPVRVWGLGQGTLHLLHPRTLLSSAAVRGRGASTLTWQVRKGQDPGPSSLHPNTWLIAGPKGASAGQEGEPRKDTWKESRSFNNTEAKTDPRRSIVGRCAVISTTPEHTANPGRPGAPRTMT